MDRIPAKENVFIRSRMSGIVACLGCLSSIIGEEQRAVRYLISRKSTIRTADKIKTVTSVPKYKTL
jgi:hypothetical protein